MLAVIETNCPSLYIKITFIPTTFAFYTFHVVLVVYLDLYTLQAWDSDAGVNSKLKYSFIPRDGDGSKRFEIDPNTGEVISTASFLGQAGASFELLVKATDQNGEGLSASKNMVVSSRR